MKRVIPVVVILALVAWWISDYLGGSAKKVPEVSPSSQSTPSLTLESAPAPPPPAPFVVRPAPSPAPEPSPSPGPVPMGIVEINLSDVLRPNNRFHDAVFGLSATYPEGWTVRNAIRWGQNHRENTVFFAPPEGSRAVPSMYYQIYSEGNPATAGAEAFLREQARSQEASRREGVADYTNDPDSFVFREIDGRPALSYFATFTQRDQVMGEYFMRILGDKGYVMFFVRGPFKDIQAIIPSVYQMGGTVRLP